MSDLILECILMSKIIPNVVTTEEYLLFIALERASTKPDKKYYIITHINSF